MASAPLRMKPRAPDRLSTQEQTLESQEAVREEKKWSWNPGDPPENPDVGEPLNRFRSCFLSPWAGVEDSGKWPETRI